MNSREAPVFPALVGALLSIALFAILVAGCGSSPIGVASSVPKPTPVPVQKCGVIGVMRTTSDANTPGNVNANVASNCFWQAFQQCHAASLIVNFGSVDTITTHTFTLQKKNTSCTISDAVQNRILPLPARNTGTYTCSGLVNTPGELRFNGCGKSGTIVVPTSQIGNPQ
jgi:hypothetical protein